jgi:hypothetical protein
VELGIAGVTSGLETRRTSIWSRRQESNLHLSLRRTPFYPLNYGEQSIAYQCHAPLFQQIAAVHYPVLSGTATELLQINAPVKAPLGSGFMHRAVARSSEARNHKLQSPTFGTQRDAQMSATDLGLDSIR